MNSFDIIMTPDAESDLKELKSYISDVLLAPETAVRYLEAIRREISKLKYAAASIAPLSYEPWRSRGVRRIIAKNFYIYFYVAENENRVYVMNIIYEKRDQLQQLNRMKFEE